MAAIVRFFCVVGPANPTLKPHWPDISFEYLTALTQAGIMVRALPIGATFLQFPKSWEHWQALQPSFYEPLAEHYVNIVCCPAGVELGKKISRRQLHPGAKSDEVVYEPQTALEGLWTAEIRNVAITGGRVSPPSESEVESLNRYDAVICPSHIDKDILVALGVKAEYYPPDKLHTDASAIPYILEGYNA